MAVPGVLRLYDHARAAGVAVFFITGRPGGAARGDGAEPAGGGLQELDRAAAAGGG